MSKEKMIEKINNITGTNFWRVDGGSEVSEEVGRIAKVVLEAFPRLSTVGISPTPEGGIMWESLLEDKSGSFAIEVKSDGSINFYGFKERDDFYFYGNESIIGSFVDIAKYQMERMGF